VISLIGWRIAELPLTLFGADDQLKAAITIAIPVEARNNA
jgi:hypothetical protein